MGRSTSARTHKKPLKKVAVKAKEAAPDVQALLAAATNSLAEFDLDNAEAFAKAACGAEESAQALEVLACVLLEKGEVDQAKETFVQATKVEGSTPSVYLSLAQLCPPKEALQHFETALKLLKEKLANPSTGDDVSVMRRSSSRALVGMTEVFLTDLCFEEDAESRCESYLTQASEIDPSDPEVYTTIASVRLSQHRTADAVAALEKSWSLWKDEPLDSILIPPFDSRLALAKLFIETEKYKIATILLAALENEDDEHVETAYLGGLAWYLLGQEPAKVSNGDLTEDESSPEECAVEARNQFVRFLRLQANVSEDDKEEGDEEILAHVKSMLEALYAAGVPQIEDGDDEEEYAGINSDEWSDTDDEDKMQE